MTSTVSVCAIIRLPPEILSEIFQTGAAIVNLPSPSSESVIRRPRPVSFEVAVSQTCSYFREVAIANAHLWTSIAINATSSAEELGCRIHRSRPCLLDVRLDLSIQDLWMTDSDQTTMLDVVLPEAFRWRSVCVKYHAEVANHPMITRLRDCWAPNLEHLSLSLHDVENPNVGVVNDSEAPPQIFKAGTPKLQFLRLRGVAIQLFRPELSHIVTLHLDQTRSLPLRYSTFRSIVTSSPYLSNLSVYGDIIQPTAWAGHDMPIYLPQLRSLRIFSESGAMYSGLLLGIDAPLLQSLTLKSVHEHDLDAVWAVANRRNYSNLKYLHFSDFDMSVTAYTRMFCTFLDVREYSAAHLFPSESGLLSALLYGMTPGLTGSMVPWPRLESLCFSFDLSRNSTVLSELAVIRQALGYPLSRIFFAVEDETLRQKPWERRGFDTGENVQVSFFAVDRAWPLNGVHGGDQDDTLFL